MISFHEDQENGPPIKAVIHGVKDATAKKSRKEHETIKVPQYSPNPK
jgi:hypothetical protein